jgi:hypothetical protein
MPAKSKKQQRIMGMAHAIQTGEMSPSESPAAAKIARTMKPGDVEEFASTKLKGLPEKKNSKPKRPKRPNPPEPPGEPMAEPAPNPNLGPPLPPPAPPPQQAPLPEPGKSTKPMTLKMPAGAKAPKPPPTPKRTMGGILSDLKRSRRAR